MILVILTILVLVSLAGVSLGFTRPLDKIFMFDFHEHLGVAILNQGDKVEYEDADH